MIIFTRPSVPLLSLSAESIPRNYQDARLLPQWQMAMNEEMEALRSRGTWELVPHPANASVVTCRWVFSVKHKANGTVDRYKTRLVARGFTQTYGVDYAETFSPVACLNSIRILLLVAINQSWALC